MDAEKKIRVELELEEALVRLAGEGGLDLNEVADRAIRRMLGTDVLAKYPPYAERLEQVRRELQEQIAHPQENVGDLGLWCDEWRRF